MGLRDYTSKEVLNKVLYNNTALRAYSLSEGLNTILDAGNNRLKVRLEGGTVAGNLIVTGTLEVQGATTIIKSETIQVTDKTFELAVPSSGSPSDATSDGGGIILKGSTDKSILWNNANDWWVFNQGVNIAGAVQIDSTVTVGVDDTGYDVKFFGATGTNGYMLWDESTDDLILGSASKLGVGVTAPTDPIHVKTTAVETRISLESSTGKWAIGAEDGDKFGILNYGTSTPFLIASGGDVTMKRDVIIGDAGEFDRQIRFDGNTLDFHIGLDDSEDKLTIGKGSTLGAPNTIFITIDENGMVTLPDNWFTVNGKVFINQDATNAYAFEIDHEGDSYNAFHVDASALTTGSAGHFYSVANRTADYALVELQDDNGSNSGYSLKLRNDGAGDYLRCYNETNLKLSIDVNGNTLMGLAGGTENSIGGSGNAENGTQRLEINGTWNPPIHGDSGSKNTGAIFRLAGGGHSNALDMGVTSASPYSAWIQGANRGSAGGDAGTYPLALNPQGGSVGIGDIAPSYKLDLKANIDSFAQRITNSHANAYGLLIDRNAGSGSADTDRKFLTCQDNSAVRLIIYSNGNVVNANDSYGSSSDKRIKNSIADASSQWNDIKSLKIRKFKKNEAGENAPYHIGVIAQELEESGMSGLVDESPAMEDQIRNNEEINEGDSVKSVKTSILYMKALKALQEAMAKIETLEAKVEALENA